jgi:secondary thiamine-phosphate synthase enzyme
MVSTGTIKLKTEGVCDMHDVTALAQEKIRESGIMNGIITIFVPGATGGLTTIEFEEGLARDFAEMWDKLAPVNAFYHHNARWGDGNGFSHVRASLLGPSITIPFTEGKMTLGTWQQVVFVDFDNRPRIRSLVCQVMGE